MQNFKYLWACRGLVLLTFLMGSQAFAVGGGSSVGPANPASIFCEELGGQSMLTVDPDGGQSGMCKIEEWALWRKMYEQGLLREHRYPGMSMPNPAAVNCEDIGGTLTYETDMSGEHGLCLVNEWALWREFHSKQ